MEKNLNRNTFPPGPHIPGGAGATPRPPSHRDKSSGTTYHGAPGVEEVVGGLVKTCHPHLRQARIACLFRQGSWKNRGRVVTSKGAVLPAQYRYLCGVDLVIIVNKSIWDSLGDRGRTVLLDHELSHFDHPRSGPGGELRWSTREHDVQEFYQVVKRHGICTGDPWRLVEAAQELDPRGPQSLQDLVPGADQDPDLEPCEELLLEGEEEEIYS